MGGAPLPSTPKVQGCKSIKLPAEPPLRGSGRGSAL